MVCRGFVEAGSLPFSGCELSAVNSPEVSVVMAVHNGANYVEDSIVSILGQVGVRIELIVVDDGSTDETSRILYAMASEDNRLRVFTQKNTGLTASLIRGCWEARAEFIARQDADDRSHPLRLSEQLRLFDRSDVGFVSCATEYVGPRDEHLAFVSRDTDPVRATEALKHRKEGPPAHGSVMIRRSAYEAVGGYRSEFYYSQDSDLWLRLAERHLIAYVPDVRYVHRKEPGSISGARRDFQSAFAKLAHQCVDARRSGATEEPLLESARQLTAQVLASKGQRSGGSTAHEISYLIGSQLVQNRDARARRYLLDVVRVRPLHLRAWVRLTQSLMQGWRLNG